MNRKKIVKIWRNIVASPVFTPALLLVFAIILCQLDLTAYDVPFLRYIGLSVSGIELDFVWFFFLISSSFVSRYYHQAKFTNHCRGLIQFADRVIEHQSKVIEEKSTRIQELENRIRWDHDNKN